MIANGGRTISHYRIVARLGSGGMGVVYRGEDTRLGREVAVKFVSEDAALGDQAVHRLRSEARAASALNHPNICTIYDIGEDEGQPFIVMEMMKGQTLRERLASGPLKVHQLVDIGIEISDALQATHSDGIIHRDIKPGNIFLTERGHVKVLDFGLAKITPRFAGSGTTFYEPTDRTGAGVTIGTVSYMSPEQAAGEQLDGRTDLFSLGVVLYECATGRHPFPGKTSAVILAAILNKTPAAPVTINPELPLRLQEIFCAFSIASSSGPSSPRTGDMNGQVDGTPATRPWRSSCLRSSPYARRRLARSRTPVPRWRGASSLPTWPPPPVSRQCVRQQADHVRRLGRRSARPGGRPFPFTGPARPSSVHGPP